MLTHAAVVAALEDERKRCENDFYLINTYGWFKDPNAPDGSGKSKFVLWPKQKDLYTSWDNNRLNITLKARQLGISWLALFYAFCNLRRTKGYDVSAISQSDREAMGLVDRLEFILENMPSWIIIEKKKAPKGYNGHTYEKTAHEVTIYHPDSDVTSIFRALPTSQNAGRSFTSSLVIMDEWAFQQWAGEVFTAAFPTINNPSGGRVLGISTAQRGTFFEELWADPLQFGFSAVFLPWWTDPRRNEAWMAATKKALRKNNKYMQEYPATPEEAFSAGEMTAFPEFSYGIHVCPSFKIPDHWTRWMSCDNGFTDPFAWYWFAVSEDGVIHVYREYSRERDDDRIYYTDQGKEVNERSQRTDANGDVSLEDIEVIVTGLDAWNTNHRDQTGKRLIDYYIEGGIEYGFAKAVTDRRLRKATVAEYLKHIDDGQGGFTAKVQIHDTCTHLIATLPKLLNDEKDAEKVADSKIDNQYDSFGYGLIYHHAERSETPEEELSEVQRRKSRKIKANKRRKRLR